MTDQGGGGALIFLRMFLEPTEVKDPVGMSFSLVAGRAEEVLPTGTGGPNVLLKHIDITDTAVDSSAQTE